ncbi:MAG: dephospho-CoA kinase [Dehalococcoidia bacterium]|nr:dephospho-CoA kinase [Dehalococcoidia bacterium]
MLVIGLTGTIGSGKSTIAGFLHEMGAIIIDADRIGHDAYVPRSSGWHMVVEAFGYDILSLDNSINRRKLGRIVFNDSAALERLNHIVHPIILKLINTRLDELRHARAKTIVLEAALLLEAKWEALVDEIWVATAPEHVIYTRLNASRNLTDSQIRTCIAAHLPVNEQLKRATRAIDTNRPLSELKAEIALLWERLGSPAK